jgi:hypothetical protein
MNKFKSVMHIALRDIHEYQKDNFIKSIDENHDQWNVLSSHLNTKKIRELNNQLGIHKINKQWNKHLD